MSLAPGGDPNALASLTRMGEAEIAAMRMMGELPSRDTRITWFLEGMLQHHGGALMMAHDALSKSTNPTLRRLASSIILGHSKEIVTLRRMLQHDGLNKPTYFSFDGLFSPRDHAIP